MRSQQIPVAARLNSFWIDFNKWAVPKAGGIEFFPRVYYHLPLNCW